MPILLKKLILIRHGETSKNAKGKLHGSEDSELLTEAGIEQMKKTAQRLKEFSPGKIYASKKARAVHSGELIARELRIPLETVEGMEERNWGEFSGRWWRDVEKLLNRMSLEDRFGYVPPGGESWQQFEMRLTSAVRTLLEQNENEAVVIVAHGGAIRAFMPFLLNAPKEESFKYDPDNASLTIFDRDNGALKVIVINDISHL